MDIEIDPGTLIVSTATIVISTVIAYFVSRDKKRLDFTFDYRKYILKKRKHVYSEIELIMESTQNQSFAFQLIMDSTAREENGKLLSQNLYDKIETLKLKSMWMSRKMAECLEDLGMFINILEGDKIDFIRNKRNEPMIKPHSNSYFRYFEFSAIQKQLLKVYFEDITSLDDIDSFRKESLYTLTLFEKAYKENLEKDRQNPAIKALLDENYETMTDKLRQEYDETKGKTGEGHE